jgi:hypothetical protein
MLSQLKADLLFVDTNTPAYLYGITAEDDKLVLWRLDVSTGDVLHEPVSVLLPPLEVTERTPEAILHDAISDGAFDE